jgi:hypothetical protein
MALDKAFAFVGLDRSSRYCGRGVLDGSAGAEDLTLRSSCALICFLSWIFSWCLFFWYSFARRPVSFCASSEALCASRACLFRLRSSWSSLHVMYQHSASEHYVEQRIHTACHAASASAQCIRSEAFCVYCVVMEVLNI